MSKAITEERDDRAAGPRSSFAGEVAPSILREDEPQLARSIGLFGLVFALVGADLLCWTVWNWSILRLAWGGLQRLSGHGVVEAPPLSPFGSTIGTLFFLGGIGGLLVHDFLEKEAQRRRVYGVVAALWFVLGAFCLVTQIVNVSAGGAHLAWAANLFLPGVGSLVLALLFGLGFLHNETERDWTDLALRCILGAGAVLALVAFFGAALRADFLLQDGVVLALLGLGFIWAFVLVRGKADDFAHRVSLGVAGFGALVILLALFRSYVLPLFYAAATRPAPYLIPTGLVLLCLGALYVLFYVLLYVENPVVVMGRRELTAFFYSPIAYFVLLGFTIVGWIDLLFFLGRALPSEVGQEPLFEPIVRVFFLNIVAVFAVLIAVPFLTMRVLSQEKDKGTLEVLLTAPVDEWSVVLGKFLATLVFFMIMWVPWALFLVALYVLGKTPFDYRPLLSFTIALAFTGSCFVSMGLFFSSITRNQVIAAVLTFAGMFGLFFVYFVNMQLQSFTPGSPWIPVLTHVSFVDLWLNSLDGKLNPVFLLFNLSATVFFLFLSVKVLEARRWT
jgi:ABC-2 type transport system permease protein